MTKKNLEIKFYCYFVYRGKKTVILWILSDIPELQYEIIPQSFELSSELLSDKI